MFFASRRRHTRFDCDWSSDVCSSDLPVVATTAEGGDANDASATVPLAEVSRGGVFAHATPIKPSTEPRTIERTMSCTSLRSEERREGKECRSRWSPYH